MKARVSTLLPLSSPLRRSQSSGSALLIILGCVALLTILVVAFLVTARTEFTTSNFYAKGVSTKLLSENVINLVMAQLREGARSTDANTTAPQAWASQPGMIRTYDASGRPYQFFKLYSWDNMVGSGQFNESDAAEIPPTGATGWSSEPNVFTDLNEPVNGTYPIIDPAAQGNVDGFSFTAQTDTSNTLSMPVKWLYVLKDGNVTVGTSTGSGTAVHITNASVTNPVIGRVAFWTDDETSKVNINTASEGTFWDSPIGNDMSEHGLMGNGGDSNSGDCGFADTIPAAEEFQATPGHPATTSLSAVFGNGTIMPDTGLSNTSLTWPLTPGAGGSYADTFGPYFSLTPRYQSGGTMGGSQPAPGSTFLPTGYRLYDSVDELAFDPSRKTLSADNNALYPETTGAVPSGRSAVGITPQVIEQRRFFLTAHSRAPEETLFGTPRISLWPLQAQTSDSLQPRTAKDNLLAFCSTLGGQPYYFQRATYFQYQPDATTGATTYIGTPSCESSTMDFSGSLSAIGSPTITPQTGVARNENIYAYLQALTDDDKTIPGFGGNFLTKYPGGTGTATDRDEILTEMFDFLRSGVNTFDDDVGIFPHYTYTPFYATSGAYAAPIGGGSTIPIAIASTGGATANTHGLGRNYTIAEVTLVFMASDIDLNDGKLHSQAPAISVTPAGTLDPTSSSAAIPPVGRRISIGPGLPWANEEDYTTGATRLFLYWDTSAKAYGSYYISAPSGLPLPYVYPITSPATPLPSTAIPIPIFCYWDTSNNGSYGSYFRDPTSGKLFICPSPPNAPTPPANPTPLPSTAVTIADPQTTAIQAFLLFRPFSVMAGNPSYAPNIRVRISNLDQLQVTFPGGNATSLGFPPGSEAVAVINSQNDALSSTDGGLFESVLDHSTADPLSGGNNGNTPACNDNTVPVPWENDGTKPSTLISAAPNYNYPFIGTSIPLPTPAYPSPFGGEDPDPFPPNGNTGGIPNNVQLTPAATMPPAPMQIHFTENSSGNYAGNEMSINGAQLQIDVLDGTTPDITKAQVLQSLQVTVPAMTLAVPTVEMANGRPYCGNEDEALGNPGNNQGGPRIPGYYNASFADPSQPPPANPGSPNINPPVTNGWRHYNYTFNQLDYYWQLPFDPRNIVLRFAASTDIARVINRGDVVRSFVINPASKVAGDMRLLAASPIQGQPKWPNDSVPIFIPLGSALGSYPINSTNGPWTDPFIKQLHSLVTDFGNGRQSYNLIQTSKSILAGNPTASPPIPATPIGFGTIQPQDLAMAVTGGALFTGEYYSGESVPVVTPELTGAFMDSKGEIPGDWTLGIGDDPDGGFVTKADEAESQIGYSSPYYSTNMGNQDFQVQNISYSPNRQVPSAIMFGTLPSRVMQGIPWCTLLFCPNPAANDNGSTDPALVHPGFGVGSSGTPGPTDYPPYSVPPDHLWLDLFWMPVVEPYAISEPFSTAGKVNLNYEIVPFGGYIYRSTALHAALKSTRILAISTNFNNPGGGYPSAKTVGLHTDNPGPQNNYSLRYGINLAATIDDFPTPDNGSYTSSAFYQRFKLLHDLFRSASEICNIFLVPERIPGLQYNPADKPVPTDASYDSMQTWWSNFKLTGDNGRESPYNQIYPRLTTKSNDFEIHMRVQVLSQSVADRSSGNFDPSAGDSIVGEYRGSAILERYLDPNQTGLPDFATKFPTDQTVTLDNYVHYRVVNTHAFNP